MPRLPDARGRRGPRGLGDLLRGLRRGDGRARPARAVDAPGQRDISQTVYAEDGTQGRSNLLLENAAVQPGRPFLRYYAYPPNGGTPREATQELPVPLSAANRARVARIGVAFVSRPTGARDNRDAVHLNDPVIVRHADPNLSVPDPACE